MKFFKEHKKESICLFVFLIIILVVLITFLVLWFGGSGDKYGTRTDGIEDVPISDSYLGDIEKIIEENTFVTDVTSSVDGRLISFDISVSDDTSADGAKGLTNTIIDNFTKEELAFYDIQVFLLDSGSNEESNYPYIGYKHKTSEGFVWSNN